MFFTCNNVDSRIRVVNFIARKVLIQFSFHIKIVNLAGLGSGRGAIPGCVRDRSPESPEDGYHDRPGLLICTANLSCQLSNSPSSWSCP